MIGEVGVGGGVVCCSMGLVHVTRSNTAIHISASSAFVRISFMSRALMPGREFKNIIVGVTDVSIRIRHHL